MSARPQKSPRRTGQPQAQRRWLRFPRPRPHSPLSPGDPSPRLSGKSFPSPSPLLHRSGGLGGWRLSCLDHPQPSPWGSCQPSCSFLSHSTLRPSPWHPRGQNPPVVTRPSPRCCLPGPLLWPLSPSAPHSGTSLGSPKTPPSSAFPGQSSSAVSRQRAHASSSQASRTPRPGRGLPRAPHRPPPTLCPDH